MTTSRDFDIRSAIPHGVAILFQPVVAMKSNEICYEVLGRLVLHGETLTPRDFFPSIEGTPFMVAFDQEVLTLALAQAGAWIRDLGVDAHLHVNASAQTLVRPGYAELVRGLLEFNSINPDYLTIEVVESCQFWRSAAAVETIKALRHLGVRIAVDDFPRQFQAQQSPDALLQWLAKNRTSVQVLKLDRSLVKAACGTDEMEGKLDRLTSQRQLGLLIRYVQFAHRIGLTVVAEGVSNDAEALTMQLCGVDALQGYAVGIPMSVNEVYHLSHRTADSRQFFFGCFEIEQPVYYA